MRGDESNHGKWPLGVIVNLFQGWDEVVRAAKLRTGKSYLERPVQHLYPIELSCDNLRGMQETSSLSPEA